MNAIRNNASYADKLHAVHRNIISSIDLDYSPGNITVSGNHAFVADFSGLKIIDISKSSALNIVGAVNLRSTGYSNSNSVKVSDSYAFVANDGWAENN